MPSLKSSRTGILVVMLSSVMLFVLVPTAHCFYLLPSTLFFIAAICFLLSPRNGILENAIFIRVGITIIESQSLQHLFGYPSNGSGLLPKP